MEKYQRKIKEPEVMRWDTLSNTHLRTARSLAAEGINFRLSTPAITEAENKLNEVWLDCLHGRATLDDFEVVNQQWATAIKIANEKAKR